MAISKRLRFEIFRRDSYTCRYCGRSAPEVVLRPDHVVPVALGGKDEPGNLVTACDDCNSGKSSVAPGSALVADVERDAMRWAAAQKLVADMLTGQVLERQEFYDQFDDEWRQWGNGAVPRPANWASSLDSFIDAGLPKEVIFDCVRRAMESEKVLHRDIFRYMCGIAWSRINKMRDLVAAEVKGGAPEPAPAEPAADERLASVLLGYLDRGDVDRAMSAVLQAAEEEGRTPPEESALVVEAADWAFADMAYRLDLLWRLIGDVFEAVPQSMNRAAVSKARQELQDDNSDPIDLVPRAFVHLVAGLKAAQIIPGAE